MDILTLKSNIENNNLKNELLIFVGTDFFIAEQYYNAIAKLHELEIKASDDLCAIITDRQSLFYTADNYLYIVRVKDLVDFPYDLMYSNNIIILTEKVHEHLLAKLDNNIVKLPALQEWQLKDYLFSTCKGADTEKLEELFTLTKNNPYRMQSEIDKINIFTDRQSILDKCFSDNMYSDLSNYTIFDLSNAIMTRNKTSIVSILKDIDKIDVEPIGLVTVLHNQFRNLALALLTRNPTANTTGLSDKQLWYITTHQSKYYSYKQIVEILLYLSDINRQLLIGNIDMSKLLHIMLCKILSC